MAVIVPVATKFDDSGIRKAKSQFAGLGKSLKTSLGAIGIGVGIAALTSALKNAAKAAVEDNKSQALLANQLRNTIGATDDQIASVEDSIRSMQFQASVADDVLRPAFAQLVRVTGDIGTATKLTQLALDVSAGTQKDLGAVTIALSKAYQGNTGALTKLGIKAKDGVDIFDALSTEFKGAAAAAADNDPFQRLNIVLQDMEEQLGAVVLPLFNDFAAFMASSDFAASVSNLFVALKNVGGQLDVLFKQVSGKGAFQTIVDLAGATAVGLAQVVFTLADIGTTAGYIFSGQWDKAGKQMGTFFDRYNKFVQGIYDEQDKAAANAGKYTPYVPYDGEKLDNVAKKSADALKKVKDAIANERKELIAFRKDMMSLSSGLLSLTTVAKDLGEFESQVVDTFKSINEKLAEGIADKKFASKGVQALKDYLAAEEALLVDRAKQRDAIVEKRGLAKALIDDVKAAIVGVGSLADLLETDTQTVTKSFSKMVDGFLVTTKTVVEEVVGGKGVLGKLKDVVTKTKAFAKQLTELKKLGLTPDLFKQIVDAGPEVGGKLAEEILSGGKESVTALNDTFKELETVSGTIAEQTAAVMYNSGVEVAGGLVAGLLSQEAQIIAAAKQLAEAFNAEYAKKLNALQIPSTGAVDAGQTLTYSLADIKLMNTAAGSPALAKSNAALANQLIARQAYTAYGTTVSVTVNAGAGANGKTIGQQIQAELNKYAKSSAK